MNTALPGHDAQEYMISVACTLVNSGTCSFIKHIWCLTKPQDSRKKKNYCGLKGLKSLKRHNPKPVPTFSLGCVLHVLVPCLSMNSPMIVSQSFLGSPAPVFSFSFFSWGYLYMPLQTEVTWQGFCLGGCGSGTELNP